jgi:hypothetical protein
MLWGRLSYDPGLPDSLFERTLSERFPEVSGKDLFSAWSAASRIIPQITRFFVLPYSRFSRLLCGRLSSKNQDGGSPCQL